MNEKSKLLQYLRLLRPQTAAMLASILLIGALIMGQRDIFSLLILFIIGVLSHIFGYVLNDYADIEIDKKSKDLKDKPLVSGIIPKQNALIIVLLSALIAFILTIIVFRSVYSVVFLTIAAILGGIYNLYGKKIPGSELLVSAGLSFFCLFGASTVSLNFPNTIYIISILFFIDSIFMHVVQGGIKDADHDYLEKAKNITTLMGVKVKDGKLIIPKSYIAFSFFLKFLFLFFIILLGLQPELNIWGSNQYILQIIVIFLLSMVFFLTYKFLYIKTFDRSKIKRLYAGINSAALAMIFIMFIPLVEIKIIIILLIMPITWYMICNKILYGKALEPQV